MKLSQMSTEKAMETMANLLPAISHVMENPKIVSLMADAEKETTETGVMKFFFSLVNALLRECKEDALEIVAILCDKPAEKVRQQTVIATAKDIMSCYDKELIDFFRSCRRARPES